MVEILQTTALISGGILVVLLLLALFSGLDFDLDFDAPDVDSGGVGWVKGILAFLAAGGYAASVALERSFSTPVVVLIGVVTGFLLVYIISAMLRFLLRQQEVTNWEMSDVLATDGTVYLRIPPSGQGIVRVNINGVPREVKARSKATTEIPTGANIRVVEVEDEFAIVEQTN